MIKAILLLTLLSACASVGPVSIEPDDTLFTVLSALIIAIVFWIGKTWIEYYFSARLEHLKHKLNKQQDKDK
jgi:Kef-type K+ transport system membrane component KefB